LGHVRYLLTKGWKLTGMLEILVWLNNLRRCNL
jgi:hypothetical protein